MERRIGAFEAKTHFSQIMETVEQGGDFIVTRRGKPVAKIVPFEEKPDLGWPEVLAKFRELRKNYRGAPGDFNTPEGHP